MTYARLGMIMSNVISLQRERCDVGNARSLNAPSYRNARSVHHPARILAPFALWGPFSAAKPSCPAPNKHKSIVRPPQLSVPELNDLVHRLSICSLLICPAKRLTTKSVAWSYCMNTRFSTLVTMSDNFRSQQGEDADFDWEDWIIEPTSEPTMGSEVG
jgi:hypothetical protein